MKTFIFPLFKRISFASLILIFVTSACKKDELTAPIQTGNAMLRIDLINIEDLALQSESASNFIRPAVNRSGANFRNNPVREKMISLGTLDVLMSDSGVSIAKEYQRFVTKAVDPSEQRMSASGGTKMATVKMGDGIYYRLIMYDQNNTQVVNQVIASGADPAIRVDGARTYRWYAFSVNETQANVPTMNNSGVVARTGLLNKDVLYANGSINTVDGDNYLNIQFRRKTARAQVRMNVRGLFATINNGTQLSLVKGAQNTPFTSMGDFNILTESFSNITTSAANVTGASMVPVTDEPTNTVKIANFYTLDTQPIAANQLKIVANRIDVRIDDGRDRVFNANNVIPYEKAHTPIIGSSVELKLRFVESPVKVNGIFWARSNIIYDSSKTDRYRLKANPGGSSPATRDTEFWNWGAATPNGAVANVDPCTRIYPENTWRMPTSAEWRSIGQPDEKKEVLGLFFGAQYAYVWNRDNDNPANPAYDDNNLFLSFGGYRTANNVVVESPVGLLIGLYATGECHYWTGSPIGTNTATAVLSSFTRLLWGFSWGNVTYPTRNKSEGRNIRCVRQVLNN